MGRERESGKVKVNFQVAPWVTAWGVVLFAQTRNTEGEANVRENKHVIFVILSLSDLWDIQVGTGKEVACTCLELGRQIWFLLPWDG